MDDSSARAAVSTRGDAKDCLPALAALTQVFQKSLIYPPDHPAIPGVVDAAAREISRLLENAGAMVIQVDRERLLVNGADLTAPAGPPRTLASLLHALDIVLMRLRAGVDTPQLVALAREFRRARTDGFRGAQLEESVKQAGLEHLEIQAIDYSGLEFEESVAERDRARGTIWATLERGLVGSPDAGLDGLPEPESLAEAVAGEITKNEGAGVGVVRQRLRKIATQLGRTPEEEKPAVVKRLARFLKSLPSALRRDLLRIDPEMPEEGLRLLSELAEELPIADVTEALLEVGQTGKGIPEGTLVLMNKLVRTTVDRPERRAELEEVFREAGVDPEAADPKAGGLGLAIQEVFQRRTSAVFNPADYQALMEKLSRNLLTGKANVWLDRYSDPRDRDGTRTHAARVAASLIADATSAEGLEGPLRFVSGATDALIERMKYDVLSTAIRGALAVSSRTEEGLAVERARSFVRAATNDDRIAAVLGAVWSAPTPVIEAFEYLQLCEERAVRPILQRISSGSSSPAQFAFQNLLATNRPESIIHELMARVGEDPTTLRSLLPLARTLPPGHTVPWMEKLLEHEEVRVRREALGFLCDHDPGEGSPLRHLRRALADPSGRVVHAAIQRLSRAPGAGAESMLVEYVSGGIPHVAVRADLRVRAMESLLSRGESGEKALFAALDATRRSLRPRAVRAARAIVAFLRRDRDAGYARAAARRWRFAPARLFGFLVPGDSVREAKS